MDTETTSSSTGSSPAPAWQPLTARQRRVLGTLMEKSKTTPDGYPMTFTGLTTGCNQKSNRSPINNYSQEQIEESVGQLRALGAVGEIQGNGRANKVRHYAYQWLGISKVEAAIMTELLLRGEQTHGELRTRASRMEPIADLAELQKLLDALHSRKLIVYLSPAGRGQMLSHNLYQEQELEQLKKAVAAGLTIRSDEEIGHESRSVTPSARTESTPSSTQAELVALRCMVEELSARVAALEKEVGVVHG